MKQKLFTALFILSITKLCSQKPVVKDENDNTPVMYYYVRIQQWVTSESNNVDSTSSVQLQPYPNWLEHLFNDIKSGRVKAYSTAEAKAPLNLKEVNNVLFRTDSIMVPNYETGEAELKISTSEITYDRINLIEFCEQWSWDANGRLTKKVLAYAPVFESDGLVVLKTLFWIKQEE